MLQIELYIKILRVVRIHTLEPYPCASPVGYRAVHIINLFRHHGFATRKDSLLFRLRISVSDTRQHYEGEVGNG